MPDDRPSRDLVAALRRGRRRPRAGPGRARAARRRTSALTIVSDARYDVDPRQRSRSTSRSSSPRSTTSRTRRPASTTSIGRTSPSRPGTTNFKIARSDRQPDGPRRLRRRRDHTLLRIDFGKRLPAGSSRDVHPDLRHPRSRAARRPGRPGSARASSRSGRGPSRASRRRAAASTVVFPPGYTIEVESDRPRRADDRRRRAHDLHDRPARRAADVLRLLRRRPAERATRSRPRPSPSTAGRSTSRSVPGPTIRPGPSGSAASLDARPAGPVGGDRPAVGRRSGRSSSPRPSASSTAGFSGPLRPGGRPDRDRLLRRLVRRRSTRRPTPGSTAACSPTAGRTRASRRGTPSRRRPAIERSRVTGEPLTPELAAAKIPLNAWGAVGTNDAAAEDYGYAASAELARLIAERAGPSGLAASGRRPSDGAAPTSRLQSTRRRRRCHGRGSPMTTFADSRGRRAERPGRRTGAASSTCSRTGPGKNSTTCGERGSSGPSEAGLLAERAAAAAPVRRGRDPRAGEWRAAADRPRRRCGPGSSSRRRSSSTPRTARSTIATPSRRAAADAGLRAPRTLETTFEGDCGIRRRGRRGRRRAGDDRRLRRGARRAPGGSRARRAGRAVVDHAGARSRSSRPTRSPRATCGGRSRRASPPVRPGTAPTTSAATGS